MFWKTMNKTNVIIYDSFYNLLKRFTGLYEIEYEIKWNIYYKECFNPNDYSITLFWVGWKFPWDE